MKDIFTKIAGMALILISLVATGLSQEQIPGELQADTAKDAVAKDAIRKDSKGSGNAKEAKDAKPDESSNSVGFTIQLVDGSKLIGTPVNLKALKIKADFGVISIPLNLINTATMSKDHKTIALKFRNNDLLTGVPQFDKIQIRTAFGQATVPVARITKVTTHTQFK